MEIKENISLKERNWFKTGGKAKYFCEPATEKEFVQAIQFALNKNLEIFVLGKGANILISDSGFNGLTINPQLKNIKIEDNLVTAGAGVEIQELIDYCLDNNLIGLEDFSNIPGTVGGSVYINIHYFSLFLSDFLIKAKIVDKKSGKVSEVNKSWFNFGYDQSTLQEKKHYLINATFRLTKVSDIQAAYAKGRRDEIIKYRNRQYPTENTCGSFFRNFYENEINFKTNGKKIVSTAYYLDKSGVRGELQKGKACVSYKHSNMIVTKDGASSLDVVNLAKEMQNLVWKNYSILPQPECQLVGFDKNPFIKSIKNI